MKSEQFTKNFNLTEFLVSANATHEGFTEQFEPDAIIIYNLRLLCVKLLQPLRDLLPNGIIHVSSGWRCQRLNEYVGGTPTGHPTGHYADIEYFENGVKDNQKIVEAVIENHLSFSQMLNENNGDWIHIGYVPGQNSNHYIPNYKPK